MTLSSRLTIAALAFAVAGAASANTTSEILSPNPKDLGDLDHYYAYSWGINKSIPSGSLLVGAKLTIKNIWDWTKEDDTLYVTLLNSAPAGVKSFYDNQGGGDYFKGKGTRVGTWSDPIGGKARNFDLTFDLGQLGLLDELETAMKDGNFGFGFDPDCHYYNDGVHLELKYAPVPEPGTFAALGLGALAFLRRKRKS